MAEEVQDLDAFPKEVREDVEGLVWLGHLEQEVKFCGHSFTLRTLKADEELYVGVLVKEYQDTLTQAKAWAWANVALALDAVDGDREFLSPIGPDRLEYARTKFKYVTEKWYWLVGEHLFQQYTSLLIRQQVAVEAMRDLSLRSPASYSASPDSLTDQADSESTEIEDLVPD